MKSTAATWQKFGLLLLTGGLITVLSAMGGCSGCGGDSPDKGLSHGDGSTANDDPIRLLVVDDPPLADAIRREWTARGTGQLAVRQISSERLLGLKRLDADALVYPSGLIGELAERNLILPVPDDVLENPTLAWHDVFRLLRLSEAAWGKQTYGLPLGSPQLVLFYRKDVFENLGLSPPQTWRDYQDLLPQLAPPNDEAAGPDDHIDEAIEDPSAADGPANSQVTRNDDTSARPTFATVEPLAPGWAAHLLMARAASYARHRNQYSTLFDFETMRPLIDGPPFVRALNELIAAAEHGPADPTRVTPATARRLLFHSVAAMALCWPTHADDQPQPEPPAEATEDDIGLRAAEGNADDEPAKVIEIGVVALPGSPDVYQIDRARWSERHRNEPQQVPLLAMAGRMGSVTRETPRARAAYAVLVWLSGPEWSGRVSSASPATTMFRKTHLDAPGVWVSSEIAAETAENYADVVRASQTSPAWLTSLRIPGRRNYLTVLDQAVHRAIRDGQEPAAALKQAAAEWDEITERLGREAQRAAYHRSLGVSP